MKFRSFTKAIFTLCISLCMLVVIGLFSTNAIAAVEPGLTYDQIIKKYSKPKQIELINKLSEKLEVLRDFAIQEKQLLCFLIDYKPSATFKASRFSFFSSN